MHSALQWCRISFYAYISCQSEIGEYQRTKIADVLFRFFFTFRARGTWKLFFCTLESRTAVLENLLSKLLLLTYCPFRFNITQVNGLIALQLFFRTQLYFACAPLALKNFFKERNRATTISEQFQAIITIGIKRVHVWDVTTNLFFHMYLTRM